MDAYHEDNYKEIDTHSLFGTMQVQASDSWFAKHNRRTFILSRSSVAGHGKFGSKWLGDNGSSVEYLAQSVLGSMSMNLFGISLIGADICGFGGGAVHELCARWYMVAAF